MFVIIKSLMTKMFLHSTLVFSIELAVLSLFVIVNKSTWAVAGETKDVSESFYASEAADNIASTKVGNAPNVSTIQEKIFFSGQPTAASLLNFREKGIQTVINLRMEAEMQTIDFDEARLVESLGMKYIHIPIGREEPTDETITLLMDTIENHSNMPMLMHCKSSSRTGYVWALYRGIRAGEPVENAIEQGKKAGMHTTVLEERARKYITEKTGI